MRTATIYDLSPGNRIGGRWTIVGPHRQGGLSSAFEARDEEDGSRCEVQVFPPALLEGDEQIAEFLRAFDAWREVESEHVVRVREVQLAGPSLLLLVTDLPEGETLRPRLEREGRLREQEAIELGLELLAGLEAIHERGLVHGDVKPLTVVLRGEAKDALLVDGGVTPALWTAKHLGERTALIGTPYYAPVEQFGGDAPSVQTDVYNVATVLYECLTGALPWHGSSFLEVFQAKLERRPPPMRERVPDVEIDPQTEEVVAGGLLADRHQRYPSATDFRRRLEGLLE